MSTSGYKMMLTVALILVVGVGASGAARADDFGKYLLGAAVGVLAYKALTDDHDCRPVYCPPPCPPVAVYAPQAWDYAPYGYYAPAPGYGYYAAAPRTVYVEPRGYAQGYGHYDGRDRGRHDGYRH